MTQSTLRRVTLCNSIVSRLKWDVPWLWKTFYLLLHFCTWPPPNNHPPTFLPVHNGYYPSKWRVNGSLHKAVCHQCKHQYLLSSNWLLVAQLFNCRLPYRPLSFKNQRFVGLKRKILYLWVKQNTPNQNFMQYIIFSSHPCWWINGCQLPYIQVSWEDLK